MSTAALLMIVQLYEPISPLADGWMKKMWYMYTEWSFYSVLKNEVMSFAVKCMELEIIMLCEISQMQKDKYDISSLYVESRPSQNDTNVKVGLFGGKGSRRKEGERGDGEYN
jgi:hypothetical protein